MAMSQDGGWQFLWLNHDDTGNPSKKACIQD
jgi:hypothetical protein